MYEFVGGSNDDGDIDDVGFDSDEDGCSRKYVTNIQLYSDHCVDILTWFEYMLSEKTFQRTFVS